MSPEEPSRLHSDIPALLPELPDIPLPVGEGDTAVGTQTDADDVSDDELVREELATLQAEEVGGKTRSRKRLFVALTVSAAAVLVAGGAAVVANVMINQAPAKVAAAPAEPSETPAETAGPEPEVLTVEPLQIKAGQSPEDLSQDVIDRLSAWVWPGQPRRPTKHGRRQ